MDINTLLQIGGSALGGGAVFKALDYFINVKKENRSDFDMINVRLNDEIKRLYLRIDDLERENKDLESRVRLLEGSSEELPFPLWHTSLNGEYIWTNQTFNNSWLLPLGKSPESIMNKKDEDIYKWFIEQIVNINKFMSQQSQQIVDLVSDYGVFDNGNTFAVIKFPDLYIHKINFI